MEESVIVSAVRLPTGKFMGALSSLPAPELGARVIREVVSRADLDPAQVDECIMGRSRPGTCSTGCDSGRPSRPRSSINNQ